ncbi:hypothetical protein [Clostridium sp. MD294]|uniref:hypothetical protein n=1 Tax=Clostridium sp. MD294 TaxID=97138 RepID=UPI0002CAC9A8|nr:hypothetical protein [Clostridium sp. MD294]NDO47102.1 hypothetical protein [Clostridium sp. MD294]USF31124.1 hypothetical protein C820_002570 [Clostridium sp. MD294]
MKQFKRIIATTILCSQILTQVWANEVVQTPCYINIVDVENSDFENGNWKYKFTASDSTSLTLEEGQKHTFLIINGKISFENVVIQNDISFISLEGICKELNLQKEENKNSIKNGLDSIVIDSSLSVKKNNEILPTKAIYVENEIYVPLKEFVTALNGAVSYTTKEIMPLYNPLICIDTREQKVTKEQALQMAKQKMNQCYQNFLLEQKNDNANKMLIQIQQKINDMQCIEDTASFWIIDAPYLLLIDKTTGEIYYKTGHGNAGHGSYVEMSDKVDTNVTNFFEFILNHGF